MSEQGLHFDILTLNSYFFTMTATITSKGQITIPLAVRQHLGLKAGDRLEFDESAPILTARRAVDHKAWSATVQAWQKASARELKGHPWATATSASMMDDLRGGPVETIRPARSKA